MCKGNEIDVGKQGKKVRRENGENGSSHAVEGPRKRRDSDVIVEALMWRNGNFPGEGQIVTKLYTCNKDIY